jgi:hypothetical protein
MEPVMSLIPDQVVRRESCASKIRKFAAAAARVSWGHGRSWTLVWTMVLALLLLLPAAGGAQGQADWGAAARGVNGADAGSGIIPTTTSLGSSTASNDTAQTILEATVQNANGNSTPAPTGTVTFFNGTAVLGSNPLDENDAATLPLNLPAGSYNITAYYSGDLQHGASTSPTVTVNVSASGFNLAVNPATVTVAAAQNATVIVTLSSVDGFADTIGLGCASLPAGVTCRFSSSSAHLTANEVPAPTVQLTIVTGYPPTGGSSAINSHAATPGAALAGLCLYLNLFFGGVLWRLRRKHTRILTTMLVLSCAALLVTGCCNISSSSSSSLAQETYVIQVTGVGAGSGIANYQNVTLNITP